MRLTEKVLHGSAWIFSLRISQRIFYFIRLIILARLLSPLDFGLVGVALLVIAILDTFSEMGFSEALVQKKENTESYLDVVWTFMTIRGTVLFLTLYFLAPAASMFFKSTEAISIIRVLGLSILIEAFTNIGIIYFQKELEFNKEFLRQLSFTFTDFIVTIPLAFILRNAWALVFGLLAAKLVGLITSYILHPYRPHFCWDWQKIKSLFRFSKWLLGSSILVFLLSHGDDLIVGGMLGAATLGLYQMAFRISNLPATEYAKLIATVTFPAYAKLQQDLSRLREAYLKVLQLTALLAMPVSGLIFILAKEFTLIFLKEKWLPMVPSMRVLSIYGLMVAIGIAGPLFIAIGKPHIRTQLQVVATVILALLIYPLTKWWGIFGASIAVTVSSSFALFAIYVALKIVGSEFKKPIKLILCPFIGTVFLIGSVTILNRFVLPVVNVINFTLVIIMGGLVYILFIYFTDLVFKFGYQKILRESLRTILQKNN